MSVLLDPAAGAASCGGGVSRGELWDDPKAAAFVRFVARGNETVPTVSVGSMNLVNPSAKKVIEVAATEAPGLPPPPSTTPRSMRRRRLFHRRNTASQIDPSKVVRLG